MNRRAFVTGLGAVLAAATAARAQQAGNVPRVGILLPGFRPSPERIARGPFIVPMRELGWVDGRSVVFERRYANERPELLPMLARELIASRVDVESPSVTSRTYHGNPSNPEAAPARFGMRTERFFGSSHLPPGVSRVRSVGRNVLKQLRKNDGHQS